MAVGGKEMGCWPSVMIKNTIMGICSEIMWIVWGKRQETLLDRTGSSRGRKVVTRAVGIVAEERDSVGEGGHREFWEDGGWWVTSWNEGVGLWHRFWPVERMQGVIAGAMVNSALQKQQVLKHPLCYLNFHITVSRSKKKDFLRKCHFLLVYVLSSTSSLRTVLPFGRIQMWNHTQKDEMMKYRVTFR